MMEKSKAGSGRQRTVDAVLVGGLLVLGGLAARRVTDETWKLLWDQSPPDPDDPDTDLRDALLWSVGSGLLVGLTRLLVRREFGRLRRQGVQGRLDAARERLPAGR